MHANRTNLIEVIADNAPDRPTMYRLVELIHIMRQFDDCGGHVPAVWIAGEDMPERPCAFCSEPGATDTYSEDGYPDMPCCADDDACQARVAA